MTAFARIALPRAKVRFSAGRTRLSDEIQTLCFYTGGNSILYGDKLLTADNPEAGKDRELLAKLGLDTLDPNPSLVNSLPAPGVRPVRVAANCFVPITFEVHPRLVASRAPRASRATSSKKSCKPRDFPAHSASAAASTWRLAAECSRPRSG
jgi:hypothetical protein